MNEHKHLGIALESKLSFTAHITFAMAKAGKGNGLLEYRFKYLVRQPLDEIYKLYVRPHLDYGHVIYHSPAKFCEYSHKLILPNVIENFESVQYSAALAITGR